MGSFSGTEVPLAFDSMSARTQWAKTSDPYFSFISRTLGSPKFEVYPLAGDASTRRYYRIVQDQQTFVLMEWEPFEESETYPFLSVQKHFQRSDIQVPKILAMSPKEGFILLEDLGDLTLERKFWETQDQKQILPFYMSAIDELVKIHFESSKDMKTCTAFSVEFDEGKFLWELNYGKTHLLENICQISLSHGTAKTLEKVFRQISTRLAKEPKFISHRDFHSRNLMIKLGKMRVIDFQDARMGPVHYDLVSLLKDSYVDLNHNTSKSILEYYLQQASELGYRKPFTFNEVIEIQTIQRCFKACGSFASFFNNRSDRRYLRYLSPTLKRVKKSLEPFTEFAPFLRVLEDSGVFKKDFNSL